MTDIKLSIQEFQEKFNNIKNEVGRIIVGNNEVVDGTLSALLAGGHVLLEGVPGLGKTLLVNSFAAALGLGFKRIQFTPDLMPSDITGTEVLSEENGSKKFVFLPGPVFTNVLLADEINRGTPKTQAALLEAMEEKQVTVLGKTHTLEQPFFVLATQNPVELEGTYPLPEAQLDRFIIKLKLDLPTDNNLKEILARTTGSQVPKANAVFKDNEAREQIAKMRELVRSVLLPSTLQDVLVKMLSALHPQNDSSGSKVKKYVRFGPGPRGAQAVVLLAKVFALLNDRVNVDFTDIKKAFVPALRHRLVLNFLAEAESVSSDDILNEIIEAKK